MSAPAPRWARSATPLVFLGLAAPTLLQLLAGDLPLDVAALRCLVAMGAALGGVHLLATLLRGYTAPPAPAAEPAAAEPPTPARRVEDVAAA